VLVGELLRLGYTDLAVLDLAAATLAQAQDRLGPPDERVTWIVWRQRARTSTSPVRSRPGADMPGGCTFSTVISSRLRHRSPRSTS
jgi:hypothetical protein